MPSGNCHDCGTAFNDFGFSVRVPSNIVPVGVCIRCFESGDYHQCQECGEVYRVSMMRHWARNGRYYCAPCYNSAPRRSCNHCEDIIMPSEIHFEDENITICFECEQYYFHCRACNRIQDRRIRTPNNICVDCLDGMVIMPYNYRPGSFNFYHIEGETVTAKTPYLGVEIEMDDAGEKHNNAKELIEIIGGPEYAYATHDGTLREGFEVVSHPMTLDYHKQLPWGEMLKKAKQMGYRSHDAETCGLHVHVSRNTFGLTRITQERNISALMYLVEKHWDEFVEFSRRTPSQLAEFAKRYLVDELERNQYCTPDYIMVKAKHRMSKYFAINIVNHQTIEIRIFRGTLRYETFIATLELCEGLVKLVTKSSIEDIQAMSWDEIKDKLCSNYEHLKEHFEYLQERQAKIKRREPLHDDGEDSVAFRRLSVGGESRYFDRMVRVATQTRPILSHSGHIPDEPQQAPQPQIEPRTEGEYRFRCIECDRIEYRDSEHPFLICVCGGVMLIVYYTGRCRECPSRIESPVTNTHRRCRWCGSSDIRWTEWIEGQDQVEPDINPVRQPFMQTSTTQEDSLSARSMIERIRFPVSYVDAIEGREDLSF